MRFRSSEFGYRNPTTSSFALVDNGGQSWWMIAKRLKMDISVENKHVIYDFVSFIQDLRLRYGLQQTQQFWFVTNPYFHVNLGNHRDGGFPCELKIATGYWQTTQIARKCRDRQTSPSRRIFWLLRLWGRSLVSLVCPVIWWTNINSIVVSFQLCFLRLLCIKIG